jgi:hypothetical protein
MRRMGLKSKKKSISCFLSFKKTRTKRNKEIIYNIIYKFFGQSFHNLSSPLLITSSNICAYLYTIHFLSSILSHLISSLYISTLLLSSLLFSSLLSSISSLFIDSSRLKSSHLTPPPPPLTTVDLSGLLVM